MAATKAVIELQIRDPDELLDRLRLMRAEAKRVERSARVLKQQSAQLIDQIESKAVKSTAEEAHDDRDNHT